MNKVQDLVIKLIQAKEKYYNDEPIMSDEEFDILENELRKLDPENDYFNIVGIPTQGEKVKHIIPMLSINKSNAIEEVENWYNKILDEKVKLIIEPKVDGGSSTNKFNNGNLQYIATRGDGFEGRIRSHLKDYVKDIIKNISEKKEIEIRGEFYLPQTTTLPNPEQTPLRNLANGLINRDKSDLDSLKYLRFVAYQLYGTDIKTESEKLEYMKKLGFHTVPYIVVNSIKEIEEYFEEYKSSLRMKWDFQTDGLIIAVNDNSLYDKIDSKYIVAHHHHYNIALKPPSESKWTSIEGITWQISRNGNIIPVVNVSPVIIGGATIKNVTANNFENIEKLKLNKGDKIHISRANDVIPYLIESVAMENKSKLIPIACPSCGILLEVKGVHLNCTNKNCPEKNIQQITYWVEKNNMDEVAEATIRILYEEKLIKNIIDLYNLKDKVQSLRKKIDGFGKKKIENLLTQIEKSKSMTIPQFLARLGIELVGEKAIKKLGIKTEQEFWNFNDLTYKIGQNLINFRENNITYLLNLMSMLNIKNLAEKGENKMKVCMTGEGPDTRKNLIIKLNSMGYEFSPSITKETNILICEDTKGNSTKLQKARKLGIKLVNYEEFFS